MARWVELFGTHVDADAVIAIERRYGDVLLALAGTAHVVAISPLPRPGEDIGFQEPNIPEPPRRPASAGPEPRWFRRSAVRAWRVARKESKENHATYLSEFAACKRVMDESAAAKAVVVQAFADARFAEIVRTITAKPRTPAKRTKS